MRAHVRALAAAALATAMFLTGCGGSSTDNSAQTERPAEEVEGAGLWEFEWEGMKGTLQFPAPADHARVVKLEEWRQVAEAAPVTYVLVTLDNTEGTEAFGELPFVHVTTQSGDRIKLEQWSNVMDEWEPAIREVNPEVSDEIRGAYQLRWDVNGEGAIAIEPGQTGEKVFYTDQNIDDIASVEVTIYPNNPDAVVEATLRE